MQHAIAESSEDWMIRQALLREEARERWWLKVVRGLCVMFILVLAGWGLFFWYLYKVHVEGRQL